MPTKRTVFPLWWMAWVAIVLLAFGVPSLGARFIALSGDPVHAALLEGRTVSDQDLDLLEASRTKTASWFPAGEFYNDLVLAAMERASRLPPQQASAYYQQAEFWQRRALGLSPADSYGWYRLSYLFYVTQGGPSKLAAAAWRQSMIAAPYEPRLTLARLQMAMSLGEATLNGEMKTYITRLIRAAWDSEPERLAALAFHGRYISVVEQAIGDDPQARERFRGKVKEAQESEK